MWKKKIIKVTATLKEIATITAERVVEKMMETVIIENTVEEKISSISKKIYTYQK